MLHISPEKMEDIKTHAKSAAITFCATFLTVFAVAIKTNLDTHDLVTGDVILSLVITAVRTAFKFAAEGFLMTAWNYVKDWFQIPDETTSV